MRFLLHCPSSPNHFSIYKTTPLLQKTHSLCHLIISSFHYYFFPQYNNLHQMNRRNNHIFISQQQQIQPNGCCLNNYCIQQENKSSMTPSRIRVYSQPKTIKEKKIDLVSNKRAHSQYKEKQFERMQLSKSPGKIGDMHVGSTVSSEKNSIKNSKISFNNDLKIQRPSQQYKNQTLSTKNTYPYLPENTPHQTFNTPNTIISQISLVSQQFISEGSATLYVLNILTPSLQNHKSTESNKTFFKLQFGKEKGVNNPLQRMMDRKRYEKKANGIKKKLIL